MGELLKSFHTLVSSNKTTRHLFPRHIRALALNELRAIRARLEDKLIYGANRESGKIYDDCTDRWDKIMIDKIALRDHPILSTLKNDWENWLKKIKAEGILYGAGIADWL